MVAWRGTHPAPVERPASTRYTLNITNRMQGGTTLPSLQNMLKALVVSLVLSLLITMGGTILRCGRIPGPRI